MINLKQILTAAIIIMNKSRLIKEKAEEKKGRHSAIWVKLLLGAWPTTSFNEVFYQSVGWTQYIICVKIHIIQFLYAPIDNCRCLLHG